MTRAVGIAPAFNACVTVSINFLRRYLVVFQSCSRIVGLHMDPGAVVAVLTLASIALGAFSFISLQVVS